MSKSVHYAYGSGMVSCLYDNGPHFTHTLTSAIDGALFPFQDDMSVAEVKRARRNLRVDGIHYFENRQTAGADYVEVSQESGPCPENDD